MIVSPTLIRRFITGFPPLLVAAVQRLVAQLAVALARDLALVHHQIAGDGSFADALSPDGASNRTYSEHCEAARFSRQGWMDTRSVSSGPLRLCDQKVGIYFSAAVLI